MKIGLGSIFHASILGVLPDQHHARQHVLAAAGDHTGEITDAQHGVRALANAHAHVGLSGIGPNDHHVRSHDHSNALDGSPIALAGLPSLTARVSKGTYAGNGAANRAIPHGLEKTPALVLVWAQDGNGRWARIHPDSNYVYYISLVTPVYGRQEATAINSTNFYVGAGDSALTMNGAGTSYCWTAISAS